MKLFAALLVCLITVPSATGATLLTRSTNRVSMKVTNSSAQVSWGKTAILCCAINALPPSQTTPQVNFKISYGKKLSGSCLKTNITLPLLVKICRSKNGSLWAVQRWRRLVPNYGGTTAPAELHVSHWTGELPKFENVGWHKGAGGIPVLDGKLTYKGDPVYGFTSTKTGVPTDTYGRLVYLDSYNSDCGTGWRRINSFLTHTGNGEFSYFLGSQGGCSGQGEKYRITANGPGVTPVIRMMVAPPQLIKEQR